MAKVLLGDMTREEVRESAASKTLVIPIAAVEQHGPDLPVTVDCIICEAVARGAAERAAAEQPDAPIIVAPLVPYGYSPHHFPYAGVFSLGAETVLAVLRDLGESAVRSGFRRIFYLNGHGGNDELIRMAAREVSNRHDVLTGAASYWSLAMQQLRESEAGRDLARIPGHAGDFEASLIMHLRPELVDRNRPAPPKPVARGALPETTVSMFTQSHLSMQRIDGYTDRSELANAERGRQLLEVIQQAVATALLHFHRSR
jgi:creatinine amidohydrolase